MSTHSTVPLSGVWNERAIAGRLMLTMEPSSVVMKVPTEISANTVHLLTVVGGSASRSDGGRLSTDRMQPRLLCSHGAQLRARRAPCRRSEEHTSELQS